MVADGASSCASGHDLLPLSLLPDVGGRRVMNDAMSILPDVSGRRVVNGAMGNQKLKPQADGSVPTVSASCDTWCPVSLPTPTQERCWLASDGLLTWAHHTGRRRNLSSPACLVPPHKRILIRMRAVAIELCPSDRVPCGRNSWRHWNFVVTDRCQHTIFRLCIWVSVQRSARERLMKACDKLGISLNPRKRLVDAAVGPVLGGELDGRLGHTWP